MKPVEFLGTAFFDLMRIQPRDTFYSTSLWLAKAILTFDMKDKEKKGMNVSANKEWLKKLEFIKHKTHEDINRPLADIEAIVASKDRTVWGREFEGKDLDDEDIEIKDERVTILDLYRHLKEAYEVVILSVVDIVQEYSSEYRMGDTEGGGFMGGGEVRE